MTIVRTEDPPNLTNGLDLVTFGQRLRHLRRTRGFTLSDLGERVGRAPSQLSLLENGRREPKLSLLQSLAMALDVPVEELLRNAPPNRRAQLEIALEDMHDSFRNELSSGQTAPLSLDVARNFLRRHASRI